MKNKATLPAAKAFKWFGWTDKGKVRANNEDSFLALSFDAREIYRLGKQGEAPLANADFVFAVCDGMGGAKAGEYASRIAVEKITTLLPRSFKQKATGLESGFADMLTELYAQVHKALAYLGNSYDECHGMETTMSLGWFTPGWMYFAHVGDSRIYYLPREGGLIQISHDHTFVGSQRRKGLMNEREARSDSRRSALQQALGAGNQFIDPQIGAVGHKPGDRFVICSDGVVDGLWDREVEELARGSSSDAAVTVAKRLVTTAVQNSGRDNATAIVVEVLEPPVA